MKQAKLKVVYANMDGEANLMDAYDSLTKAIFHIEKAMDYSRFANQCLKDLPKEAA